MVTNSLFKKIRTLVTIMTLFVLISSMKCTRNEAPIVNFGIENKTDDSVRIEYVGHRYGHQSFILPFTDNFSNEACFVKDIYSTNWDIEDELEDANDLSWNEAMELLGNNIDSVNIIRVQNGKYVLYSHAENASEQEKFFFTQDAWEIDNETYSTTNQLISRKYTFVITDETFH